VILAKELKTDLIDELKTELMKEFKNEIRAAVESETAEIRSELSSLKDQNSMLHAALQDN
jgi:hypothetical protein